VTARSTVGGTDQAGSPWAALTSPEQVAAGLLASDYLADEGLATAVFLALKLGKPMLLEGPPGVGKTEAAKAVASMANRAVIRLQCYEGIDASQALYEWNYPRQLLALRQAGERPIDLYADDFLIERPLLAALRAPRSKLLLIDEIDRADHEFEAYLLEFLSDFQISIPEIGTYRASEQPIVVMTSNRTRDLHEALRRRCIYHWIEYPDAEREAEIILRRAGDVVRDTAEAVARAVASLRSVGLAKPPGIAEAIEWSQAATLLKGVGGWPEAFRRAVGVVIKDEEDLTLVAPKLDQLLKEACQ
jgi:MoxR-like ATPase